ncbi:alpha/beta hydrolase [Martelella sp. FLE1502]
MSHTVATLKVTDIAVRTFRGGEGRRILFLHGGAGLAAWTPFFDAMSKIGDFMAVEHPGFGKSDSPASIRSMSDLAYFYLDLIEQEELQDFHLIGNSLGGWLASEIAIRNPSRLKSLTLIAPSGLQDQQNPTANPFALSFEENTRILFKNQAIADKILSAPVDAAALANQVKNNMAVARLGGQNGISNPDLGKWLHRVKVPSLIVWGDSDALNPPAYAGLWTGLIPGARKAIIADAGHLPHAEQAAATAGAVGDFLKAVNAG